MGNNGQEPSDGRTPDAIKAKTPEDITTNQNDPQAKPMSPIAPPAKDDEMSRARDINSSQKDSGFATKAKKIERKEEKGRTKAGPIDPFAPSERYQTGVKDLRDIDSKFAVPKLNPPKGLKFIPPTNYSVSSLRMKMTDLDPAQYAVETYGGSGPNEAANYTLNVSYISSSVSLGIVYDRSQWLDVRTNTGKFTQNVYLDVCANTSLDADWFAFIPCAMVGEGQGIYKERNLADEIETHEKSGLVHKTYLRFILFIPLSFSNESQRIAIEGLVGASSDPFLYGAFMQSWIKTPFLGLMVGGELYQNQRQIISVGWAHATGK